MTSFWKSCLHKQQVTVVLQCNDWRIYYLLSIVVVAVAVFDSESETSNASEFPAETIEHMTFSQSEEQILDKLK